MQGGVRVNLFTALQKKSIICLFRYSFCEIGKTIVVQAAEQRSRKCGSGTLTFAVNKQQRLLSIGLQNFRAYFKFYAFIDGETIKQDSGECGMIGLR